MFSIYVGEIMLSVSFVFQ